MKKVAFAHTYSCGQPMIIAWLASEYNKDIRQHAVIRKDESTSYWPDDPDKFRREFHAAIPPCDTNGVTVDGIFFPWQKLEFLLAPPEEQDNYTYSISLKSQFSQFNDVSDEMFEKIAEMTRQGNWMEFDTETWMK